MADKSIIVIGAGLAGLATGCYAQMNGYSSQIFEHHTTPGGVVTAWKRKGYLIDGAIHFLMGLKPGLPTYEMYRELGLVQTNRFVPLTCCRFLDEASGRTVDLTPDLDRLAEELKAISPDDASIIDDLIAGGSAMRGLDFGAVGLGTAPELMGPLGQVKQMWAMRRIFKYFTGRYAQSVADYASGIKDPWLRSFVENLFLPEVPVWFVFAILGFMAGQDLAVLEGGSLNFVLPMERRYRDLGGQVTYRSTVEQILVENDRAVGVRLADGREYGADVVVSAADGYSTTFEMLGGRYVDDRIVHRYKNWELFRPQIIANFGVAREFPDEPCMSFITLKRPFPVGEEVIDKLLLRIFNYSPRFAPAGKTVVQVEFDTDWDYWNDLQERDRPRYDAEKERVASEALERLETYYPDLSSQVEMTDVATPYTTWRYTRNYKGAYEGWLLTPETFKGRVAKTLPGLAGFYMAGQWVMPGGGVLAALYSGRHVAQILCHEDGRPFTSSPS